MKDETLRQRDFYKFAHGLAEGDHHAGVVGGDWLEEHDDPVRAYIFRHGVREHQVADRGVDVAHAWQPNNPAFGEPPDIAEPPAHEGWPGVIFKDEGRLPRRLEGTSRYRPLGAPVGPLTEWARPNGHERVELFVAAPLDGMSSERYAIRYTLHLGRRNLRVVAPVGAEHLDAIAEDLPPDSHEAREFRAWAHRLRRGEHQDKATPLARLKLGPGIAADHGWQKTPATIHHFFDESGARMGSVKLIEKPNMGPNGDQHHLQITWVGRPPGQGEGNTLGGEAMRSLHDQLAEAYPHATHLSGLRVSGHREEKAIQDQFVTVPIRRRQTKLARQVFQAPAPGAIANQQFYKGGQFIAKSKRRIRDVASRLVKLARPDAATYNALVSAITAEPTDTNARLVFADHLQDHGLIGAHVIRAHVGDVNRPVNAHPGSRLAQLIPGSRDNSPIVAVHADGSVNRYGPNEDSKPKDFERDNGEAHLAQAYTKGPAFAGRTGVAVAVLHHTRDPNNPDAPVRRLIHIAHASTADELRHLLSDFPAAARQHLLQEWIDSGLLKKRLSGKGSGKFKMARGDQQTRGHALTGSPAPGERYDQPLTLGQLKAIENEHNLPQSHRLSPHATQSPLRTGDEHPYSVTIDQAIKFAGHLSRSAIGPGKLKKALLSPGVSEGEKHVHLMTQLLGDYADAPHGGWYSDGVDVLDRLLHHRFGFGRLDRSGKLIGKGAPHENHPGLVLFKTLVGATSPAQNPMDNARSSIRMWAAGERRAKEHGSDDPVAHIPLFQEDDLKEWMERLAALHGLAPHDLPQPGHTSNEKAKWYARFVKPFEREMGVEEGKIGYSSLEHSVYFHDDDETHQHHGVWHTDNKGNRNKAAPVPSRTSAILRNVKLPATDSTGAIRPKGWSTYGKNTALAITRLKKLVDRFRTPDGGTQSAYRKAAEWLFSFHPPEEFSDEERKKVYSGGYYEPHESAPGFFVFGPKIGAFISNLHSNDPATRESHGAPFTHDTWMHRQLLRHLGRLTDDKSSKSPSANDRRLVRSTFDALSKQLGITPAELQADLWYYEQGLMRRLGVPGSRIQSLSFRQAAEKFLGKKSPHRLARRENLKSHKTGIALEVVHSDKYVRGPITIRTIKPVKNKETGQWVWGWDYTPRPVAAHDNHGFDDYDDVVGKPLDPGEVWAHTNGKEGQGPKASDDTHDGRDENQWFPEDHYALARTPSINHAALLASLGGKTWKRHSKQTAIQKHSDGSISVFHHGVKMVTAHPDGTVKKHRGKFYKGRLAV